MFECLIICRVLGKLRHFEFMYNVYANQRGKAGHRNAAAAAFAKIKGRQTTKEFLANRFKVSEKEVKEIDFFQYFD